ncbi:glycine zipper family protein [Streptomyces sp. NBC_01356]|uniref:general stress protein n=1 Tax=Streptomyces sp. NBC_01356 TaxID=2903836 RepID=UPI002E3177D7|nr:general stress protein [Streptomyces sp. NBC_01356]
MSGIAWSIGGHGREDWLMDEEARRTIASYTTYPEAERAVDHLSDPGFPVQRLAIRQDVRLVEQMTGRMGLGGAALHGAASRAPIGGISGLLNQLDLLVPGLLLALYGLVLRALVGALSGLLVNAAQRGRRDFAPVSCTQPGRYDVATDEAVQLPAELRSGTGTGSGARKGGLPRSGPAAT